MATRAANGIGHEAVLRPAEKGADVIISDIRAGAERAGRHPEDGADVIVLLLLVFRRTINRSAYAVEGGAMLG